MFQLTKIHPRYQKYKPTNIDWIGDIPEGWEVWKLKRLGDIETGNTPSKADEENYSDEGIPWIKPDNLNDFTPLDTSKEKLSTIGLSQARLILKGSVLVCGIGTIGKIGVAGSDLTTNQQINSITFNHKINEAFGQYVVFASRKEMEKQSNKVVVSILNKSQQSNIIYPVPSIQEQQKIASYLDEKTILIDEAIAKKEHQIQLLTEHRTALINTAITKGLDPNVEMKESGVEWIGMIPKGWNVKKMKFLGCIFNGATPKSDILEYWDGEITWATPEDLSQLQGKYIQESKRHITEQGYKSCGTNLVPINSIILSCRAPIGLLAINKVPLCSNQGCKSIVPNDQTSAIFLYYCLLANKEKLDALGSGTTFKELSSKRLSDFFIATPPLKEQKQIVEYLEKETTYIDAMKAKLEQSIDLLKEYKTSLISHAVSGKINVS